MIVRLEINSPMHTKVVGLSASSKLNVKQSSLRRFMSSVLKLASCLATLVPTLGRAHMFPILCLPTYLDMPCLWNSLACLPAFLVVFQSNKEALRGYQAYPH
jgi:hypothetical protein